MTLSEVLAVIWGLAVVYLLIKITGLLTLINSYFDDDRNDC
jgi:hypothetical protein